MDKMTKRVKRQSGEWVDFDIDKLRYSLSKSGASEIEIGEVLERLIPQIHDGISSKQIYKLAFNHLKNISGTFAARYSLKRALLELGPAGFYFEKWVSKFLRHLGYETCENNVIQGGAVTHEADVIAKKEGELLWIECKFKNSMESKIPVTTPMYLLSRIKDISITEHYLFGQSLSFTQGWLITNSYFTSDAIRFGEYYHLHMLSWDYPAKKSIKNLVDQLALYPVTCLTTLSKREKNYLLDKNVILVKEIAENPGVLRNNSVINQRNVSKVLKEVNELVYLL
jgi:hypothetical protein